MIKMILAVLVVAFLLLLFILMPKKDKIAVVGALAGTIALLLTSAGILYLIYLAF